MSRRKKKGDSRLPLRNAIPLQPTGVNLSKPPVMAAPSKLPVVGYAPKASASRGTRVKRIAAAVTGAALAVGIPELAARQLHNANRRAETMAVQKLVAEMRTKGLFHAAQDPKINAKLQRITAVTQRRQDRINLAHRISRGISLPLAAAGAYGGYRLAGGKPLRFKKKVPPRRK